MSTIIQECWCVFDEDFIFEDGLYKFMPSICVWGEMPRYLLDGKKIYEFRTSLSPFPQTFWGIDIDKKKAFGDCKSICYIANAIAGLDSMDMNKISAAAAVDYRCSKGQK